MKRENKENDVLLPRKFGLFCFILISITFLFVFNGCKGSNDSSKNSQISNTYFKEYKNIPITVPKSDKYGDPTGESKVVGGEAVAIFDADGDHIDDVAIVTADPYYNIILNKVDSLGNHTFTLQSPTMVGIQGDGKTNNPSSVGLHDFNNDGLLDLYLGNYGKGNISLQYPRSTSGVFDLSTDNKTDAGLYRDSGYRTYLSNGNGTFTYQDINGDADGSTRSAVFADFDGDGYIDMFTSNAPYFGIWWQGSSAPNELRKGKADGTFGDDIIDTVVSNDPGDLWKDALARANKDFKGAIVRDFDGDGKPDIIISAISDIWDSYTENGYNVWTQEPDGNDVDVDGDGNGDGGYQGTWKRGILILRNTSTPGTISFEDVSASAIDNALGTTDQMHTYITVPADIDHDGDLDLLASGPKYFFAHNSYALNTDRIRVYRNDSSSGTISFTNITADSGIDALNDDNKLASVSSNAYPVIVPKIMKDGSNAIMTPLLSAAAALDIDNDGDMDWVAIDRQLLARNPINGSEFFCWIFLNDGTGHFSIVPSSTHGLTHTGRDLSYADLNQDGKLDLVIVNDSGGGQQVDSNNYIYYNNIQNNNHWINIRVRGVPGNALGLGTKVTVYKAGSMEILGYEELRTDFAYRSKRPASLHFGLGNVDNVDVKLVFPNGTSKIVSGVSSDQRVILQY